MQVETVTYIEFYLAGDCIFSCKKEWLPDITDVEFKGSELAYINKVESSLVTWAEQTITLPITLPNDFMDKLLEGNNGISYRSNKL